MNKSKLEFRNYKVSNYEECLELFEANCPAYFAVEEREDYREFLKSMNDQYFLGYVNGSLICCFHLLEEEERKEGRKEGRTGFDFKSHNPTLKGGEKGPVRPEVSHIEDASNTDAVSICKVA